MSGEKWKLLWSSRKQRAAWHWVVAYSLKVKTFYVLAGQKIRPNEIIFVPPPLRQTVRWQVVAATDRLGFILS
jgi:hypothetical protein